MEALWRTSSEGIKTSEGNLPNLVKERYLNAAHECDIFCALASLSGFGMYYALANSDFITNVNNHTLAELKK